MHDPDRDMTPPESTRGAEETAPGERAAAWLVGYRWVLLAVAIVTCLAGLRPALSLTFEESIESLFADDNPRLRAYRDSKAWFGGDEFVIVAWREPELFLQGNQLSQPARLHLQQLTDQIRQVPGLDQPSTQNLADALKFPYGRALVREFLEGLLLGSDGETTAIIARLVPARESPISRAEIFQRIRDIAAREDPPAFVLGEPIQVHDMFRYVERDGATLGIASTGLLLLVILVLFRSLRWMVLPLLIVQGSLILTKALLVLSGTPLSMVSSMLDSLTIIIGIATVMHITLRYRDEVRNCDRTTALTRTIAGLGLPIFWTIVTTAAGFGSLLSSRIAPVASFGLMMTTATLGVLVMTALLTPGLVLLGRKTATPAVPLFEDRLTRNLGGITRAVGRRPALYAVGMFGIMAFCAAGLLRLEVETDFSKNFRSNSPIVQALNFFETKLGGAGTWEVDFPAPHELDEEFLDKVRHLTEDLRELEKRQGLDRLTKVISLTDGLELVPSRILFTRFSVETRMALLSGIQSQFADGLYNAREGRMRIVLRALERQPAETKLKLIADVEATARRHFPEAEATGLFVLLTFLIDSLLADQWSSFLLAAAAIVLTMAVAFRDWRVGLISLLPNLFPIVLVIGSMGWVGVPINIATAMIASVSVGLTVDSTIHYIWSFREKRRQGVPFDDALETTHQGVGLALVFSNVALVAGFSVLTLSYFIPTIYFGILVSLAMLGGLLGNLVLLPILLRFTDRPTQAGDGIAGS